MEHIFGSAIIAAMVSTAISVVIFLVREKKIEPGRWKKNIEFKHLEKQLETHGMLLTMLESFAQRAKRQDVGGSSGIPHLLQFPTDLDKIKEIFEKSRYLLPKELVDEYLSMVRKDECFQDSGSRKEGKSCGILCDLSKMEELTKRKFEELEEKLKKLVL